MTRKRRRNRINAQTFISYAQEDSHFTIDVAKRLRAAGAEIWIDQLDIPPGQRWDLAVQKALEACRHVLLILTPAAIESTNVLDEVRYALDNGKQIIPVLYRDCKVPFWLHRLQRIDVRTNITVLLRTLALRGRTLSRLDRKNCG